MKTCKNCKFYRDEGFKNWGDCASPLPEYVYDLDIYNLNSQVWHCEGYTNHAIECSMYKEK